MFMDRLAEKLDIKPGHQVCVVDAPNGVVATLQEVLLDGVRVTDYIGLRGFDHILWWPQSLNGLAPQLTRLAYCIQPAGSIWLVIPKRQFALVRGIDFSWAEMQAVALQTDLVDNKTVSISDSDYCTRFVIRTQHRYKYL